MCSGGEGQWSNVYGNSRAQRRVIILSTIAVKENINSSSYAHGRVIIKYNCGEGM